MAVSHLDRQFMQPLNTDTLLLIGLAIAFIVIFVLLYFLLKEKNKNKLLNEAVHQNSLDINTLKNNLIYKDNELLQIDILKQEITSLKTQNMGLLDELSAARSKYAEIKSRLEERDSAHEEKMQMLESSKEHLKLLFKETAENIFTQKSSEFTQKNVEQLGFLLKPFRENMDGFKKKIEELYVNETKERHSLESEIKRLIELNQQIDKDAKALTNALKSDFKKQGLWGEMVLERILELSGLRAGYEYEVQRSFRGEEGDRQVPDVIIKLPDNKDVIVDSKVTLNAYALLVNTKEEAQRDAYLKQFTDAVKAHITSLGNKNYEQIYSLNTLDYVIMFVPIEAAFLSAIEHDPGIFELAYKKGVMLVSPSTLLATLKTIESIWRLERQNENAEEIANQAALMYDKFVGFLGDFQKVGETIDRAKESYNGALNKLSTGRGDLISRAEKLKVLGVRSKKEIKDIKGLEEINRD